MHPHHRQNATLTGLSDGCEALFTTSHRFTFNGQERTDEIAGTGNHTTALYWEYDSRLGRRWNVDPVPQIFLSDYSVLSLNPIHNIDPNGDSYSPIFDAETGDYLGSDSEGFAKGDVLYMNKSKFLELSDGNSRTIDHETAVKESKYSNQTLPQSDHGLSLFRKSSTTISRALLYAYEGIRPNLVNNKIHVVDWPESPHIAFNDQDFLSKDGSYKYGVFFNYSKRSEYLSTPLDIFTTFYHEYIGHGVLNLSRSDEDHKIIYEKQYKHPSFNGLTKTKQEFIKNKLTTLGYKF